LGGFQTWRWRIGHDERLGHRALSAVRRRTCRADNDAAVVRRRRCSLCGAVRRSNAGCAPLLGSKSSFRSLIETGSNVPVGTLYCR